MAYFSIVLSQIIGFVIYILIGIAAVRMRVLGSRSLGVFSRFITKISLPLLLFSNTLNGATRQQFISALPVLAVTVLMYFLLYLLCLFLARLFGLKGNENHVYRACAMFGNIGFMGIAIVLAIVGIFTGIELPAPVNTALTKAGALTTPLAMIYMGGLFCYIDIPRYIRKKEFYGAVAIKMCLFPPLFYMLCQTLGVIHDVTVTMSLLSALPSMAAVVMLAQNQHSAGNYAAGMILVTTLCSIVTLPLVCLGLG